MKFLVILLIVFNFFTFLLFGYDKHLARRHKTRIHEATLLRLALMGGSIGAVFAQKFFRHKTQKYRYLFWVILVIQFSIFELVWFYGPELAQMVRNLWV